MPGVFGMGLLHGGLLAQHLASWVGLANVVSFRIRFTGQVWPDDVLRFIGGVTGVRDEDGQRLADLTLGVTRQTRLLEKHPNLETSIRLRLPYIEPLNLLQIELLKRHRAGESDPRIGEGILLSINAIATALRNSG